MKRINFLALLATGLLGLPVLATYAEDDAKKPEANDTEALFKKLDKNGDGKLVPDEIPEEQGRFFDRLVRLGDKDDNGELTKAEFDAAIQRSDAPVQGGGFGGGPGGAGGRPMPDFKQMLERLDKNKDGKLSKDEIPEDGPLRFLREMMTRQNKDSITAEDFEQARQRMAGGAPGGRPGAGPPGEFLKRLDKNNDGKLQKEELPEGLRDRLAKVFEKLGKNELTQDEFGRAMAELGPGPGAPGAPGNPGGRPIQNPEEQFKRMDTNGDGKVTLDEIPAEFRDRVRPMFERAKKEVLTLDDVRALAQQTREAGRPAASDRKPETDRPDARRGDADRKPDGDRKPDEPRRDGDRRPDEPRRDGAGRPNPEGDRRPGPDGGRRPDGQPGQRPDGQPGQRRPAEGDRRPDGDGQRRGPMPRFFEILDRNHDGRISKDELDRLREVFAELDRNNDGYLDPAELLGPPQGPPDGRGPDGRGPDGRGPDGNRPPEGRRPDGQPPRDGDRRPDGQPPRDGERRPDARRPEGDRPRDGERKPEPRQEGRPQRREGEADKPRDNA